MNPRRHGKSSVFRGRRRRKGSQTLEVVFVLPILLLASIATIQFGVAMVVAQAVSHAATVGAREAGKMADTVAPGVDMDELEKVIEAVLAPHGITIGAHASFVLEDPTAAVPVDQRGTLPCGHPTTPTVHPSEVRVTVCVDLSKRPFLNCLKSVGVDFTGKRFSATSLVKKETAT